MDIELGDDFTYEKLISFYSNLNPLTIDQIAKSVDKRLILEIIPPFIIVKLDPKAQIPLDMTKLLDIWMRYMNKEYPLSSIEVSESNHFYITRYEESLMIAKDGEEETLYFIGKFAPGEIIIVSHAGPTTEKILRFKLLMNLYNSIIAKIKQNEKKKENK